MKEQKDIVYIAYNLKTLKIVSTSRNYTREFHEICKDDEIGWLNRTHENIFHTLKKINEANKTDY